ncbi:hypothetical protein D3C80_2036200 [compost metagenome]
MQIINIRSSTEGIKLAEGTLEKLGDIGSRSSLRFAVQLLTPSNILAKTAGRDTITRDDVDEIDNLFYDAKASARLLVERSKDYIHQ